MSAWLKHHDQTDRRQAYFTPTIVTPGKRTPLGRTTSTFSVLEPYDFIVIKAQTQIPISHAAASAANAGILKERYLPTAHPYLL